MWYTLRPLLLILSVTLNISFVTVWAIRAFQQKPEAGCAVKSCDNDSGGIWCPLHRRLGLRDAQWRELEPRMRAFRDSSLVLRDRMRTLRAGLIDLLAEGNPDLDALEARQREIADGQREMQRLTIAHLLEEKRHLTADQWATMLGLLRGQKGCGRHGPMQSLGRGGCSDSFLP